jgi:hypothetical protein
VVLFDSDQRILVGEGLMEDRAVGEDVEIRFSPPGGIFVRNVEMEADPDKELKGAYLLTVTNDRAEPIRFEADFGFAEGRRVDAVGRNRGKWQNRKGRSFWIATIPANGKLELAYRIR